MSAKEFGALMERRMAELGISQNRLASRLGELEDGRIFDATQVRLIREGRRRLDHVLVQRLIELLAMDEAQAWAAAGLWPPDLDLEGYRRYRQEVVGAGTTRSSLTQQFVRFPAYAPRMGALIPFPAERRVGRPDRRRRTRYLELAELTRVPA